MNAVNVLQFKKLNNNKQHNNDINQKKMYGEGGRERFVTGVYVSSGGAAVMCQSSCLTLGVT